MVDQRSAFGFDQAQVDKWDARETGAALQQLLAKIGKMSRTTGNDEQIRAQLVNDPDAISGLEHIKSLVREPAGGSNR